MRVPRGEGGGELAGGPTDVAERGVSGEVELLGQDLKIPQGDALHRLHELLKASRVAVELVEHRLAGMLDLVLRLAALQSLGQVTPEAIQPRVCHLQDPADVG